MPRPHPRRTPLKTRRAELEHRFWVARQVLRLIVLAALTLGILALVVIPVSHWETPTIDRFLPWLR